MWKCKECNKTMDRLLIHWGTSCGQKVDVLDYFCQYCPSNELEFIGTKEEKEEYWDREWEGKI